MVQVEPPSSERQDLCELVTITARPLPIRIFRLPIPSVQPSGTVAMDQLSPRSPLTRMPFPSIAPMNLPPMTSRKLNARGLRQASPGRLNNAEAPSRQSSPSSESFDTSENIT